MSTTPSENVTPDPRIESFPTEPRRRPRWLVLVLIVFVLAAGTLFGGYRYIAGAISPSGMPGADVQVRLAKGLSTDQISETLAMAGVVHRARVFAYWTKFGGKGPYQAGEYTLQRNSSYQTVADILSKGQKAPDARLLVPEGLRLDQIAELVGKLPGRTAARFKELATNGSIRSPLEPTGVNSLEGLLFPSTYQIGANDDEGRIIQRMIDTMVRVSTESGLQQAAEDRKLSPYQLLIEASLIEREAKLDEDRPLIAEVIANRLGKNMRLEIDATAIYALAQQGKKPSGPKGTPTVADLNVASPYNTYKTPGLPPGPIAAPGRASIQAAAAPAQGPFLFYVVTSADGKHAFAATLAEHNANVAKARAAGILP